VPINVCAKARCNDRASLTDGNQVSHHGRRIEKLKQAIGPKSRVFIVWDDHEGYVEAEITGGAVASIAY